MQKIMSSLKQKAQTQEREHKVKKQQILEMATYNELTRKRLE